MSKSLKKAFTLIELLVVIGIIGILSGLILISVDSTKSVAVDSARKTDMNSLKKILLAYKTLNGSYPIQLTECNIGDTNSSGCLVLNTALSPDYINKIPTDPSGSYYRYQSTGGISYTLSSILSSGEKYTYSPSSGFSSISCGETVTFIYNGAYVTYGTVVSPAGKCWLDRNLGATRVAIAYNDSAAYGDLFQWGRLDDGHQIRTSTISTDLSTSSNPGNNYYIANSACSTSVSPYCNWLATPDNNLWQGVSGVNNPCPSGFRLPTLAEWTDEINAGGWTGHASTFASSLKLTVAGYRPYTTGTLTYVGSYGYYWSSLISSTTRSYYFYNYSSSSTTTRTYRASGFSVRCIRD